MQLLWYYLILINAVACTLMLVDKHKAKRKQWRIPETLLFTAAVVGGSLGSVVGMLCFRHKTRHPLFSVGCPVLLLIHGGILLFLQTGL